MRKHPICLERYRMFGEINTPLHKKRRKRKKNLLDVIC